MARTSGVKGEKLGKPDRRRLIPCANGEVDGSSTSVDAIYGDEDACRATVETTDAIQGENLEVTGGEQDARKVKTKDAILLCGDGPPGEASDDEEIMHLEAQTIPRNLVVYDYLDQDVNTMLILPYSRHHDGSIYKGSFGWKEAYLLMNHNETRFEAMMLSNPKDGKHHSPCQMLQIFSLKLAKVRMDGGSVELYGYIATGDVLDPLLNYVVNFSRDDPIIMGQLAKVRVNGGSVELYGYIATGDVLDPLLNYVVNFSRDDPIIMGQGSLIQMTGPKPGIELCDSTLIEYDMRIKAGEQEKDDLQLIDGVSIVDEMRINSCYTFTRRIHGDCGAVDITVSRLDNAVEATVEVAISEVQSSFNLCLDCFISGLHQEIQLFDGAISESRGLKRSVVAVVIDTWMDLRFKVGSSGPYSSDAEHCCSFKAFVDGCSSKQLKVEFASISVKVTCRRCLSAL